MYIYWSFGGTCCLQGRGFQLPLSWIWKQKFLPETFGICLYQATKSQSSDVSNFIYFILFLVLHKNLSYKSRKYNTTCVLESRRRTLGILRPVEGWTVTDVLKYRCAFIWRVKQSENLDCIYSCSKHGPQCEIFRCVLILGWRRVEIERWSFVLEFADFLRTLETTFRVLPRVRGLVLNTLSQRDIPTGKRHTGLNPVTKVWWIKHQPVGLYCSQMTGRSWSIGAWWHARWSRWWGSLGRQHVPTKPLDSRTKWKERTGLWKHRVKVFNESNNEARRSGGSMYDR
jgi:hypothetical protein